MNVLVFNCGSSSLKYRLIAMPEETELAGGEAQRIGPPTAEPSRIVHHIGAERETITVPMASHAEAFNQVMQILSRESAMTVHAVGHRVVHGGEWFECPTKIGSAEYDLLQKTSSLAPLHNPPAMNLIDACRTLYPYLDQVAVFDTAFHSSIPIHARSYALPQPLVARLGLRKYGFHGISHQFVLEQAAKFLCRDTKEMNAVSCHLGSGGASLCAISKGRSIDNTMGYSPLQGLVMSTRCGDIDPAIALQLLTLNHGDHSVVEKAFNKSSGVLGMSGISADIRDVLSFAGDSERSSTRINLTRQVYLWRIRKYLGAYLLALGKADAVIFTDTIGELVPEVRWNVCAGMDFFGLEISHTLNEDVMEFPADISKPGSAVRVLVIQTNEELAIARRTYRTMAPDSDSSRQGAAA
ncbi:MAG TPA: acetate/propionate family kinase [bacterium]|nr:acetate/propionate family kinase [bacterium]